MWFVTSPTRFPFNTSKPSRSNTSMPQRTPSDPSASATAVATPRRKALGDGPLPSGCSRLDITTTKQPVSESTQTLVPVNPV